MNKSREELLQEMASNLDGMQLMHEVATPGVVQSINVSDSNDISIKEKTDK